MGEMDAHDFALREYLEVCKEIGVKAVNLPVMGQCKHCGSIFYRHVKHHKYCQASCRISAFNKRKLERENALTKPKGGA